MTLIQLSDIGELLPVWLRSPLLLPYRRPRMVYIILPAQPSDAAAIAVISNDAFASDPIISRLMPDVPPDARHAFSTRRFEKDFATADVDGTNFFKLVEEGSG